MCLGESEVVCCQQRTHGVMASLPFRRVLATGYHDGPIEGFTSCSICERSYGFHLLAWDNMQDTRIFGFSPISVSFDEIAARLAVKPCGGSGLTLVPPLSESLDEFVSQLLGIPITVAAVIDGSWPGRSKVWKKVDGVEFKDFYDLISQLEV